MSGATAYRRPRRTLAWLPWLLVTVVPPVVFVAIRAALVLIVDDGELLFFRNDLVAGVGFAAELVQGLAVAGSGSGAPGLSP